MAAQNCKHHWDIPGSKEKRLFCTLCGCHFDYAQYVADLTAKLEKTEAIIPLAQDLMITKGRGFSVMVDAEKFDALAEGLKALEGA
jgi:hypothetical protein